MNIIGRPIFQYAYVVRDLDEAAHHWISIFGAGPFWMVRHHRSPGYFRYREGEIQADVSYAFAYCGPVQIQLIQQHDEQPSIYREMFDTGQQGFHHVGIHSATFSRDKKALQDIGLEVALEMWSGADVVYFDARKLIGCFVEIHGDSPKISQAFADMKREHDTWDGRTQPLREMSAADAEPK